MIVLIADSHVALGSPKEDDFFQMLDAVAQTDYDVLFLGDNLDIWIASSPKYENDSHRRFLAWCTREKARRRVILVEGNHEFYVAAHHADAFTLCTPTLYRQDGITFVHGDMTHARWSFHRLFRAFSKNRLGDAIMAHLPGGVAFALWMKRILAHDGPRPWKRKPQQDTIPFDCINAWASQEHTASGNDRLIMGHFHSGATKTLPSGMSYTILPAWKNDGEIALLDSSTRSLSIAPWRTLLTNHNTRAPQPQL